MTRACRHSKTHLDTHTHIVVCHSLLLYPKGLCVWWFANCTSLQTHPNLHIHTHTHTHTDISGPDTAV